MSQRTPLATYVAYLLRGIEVQQATQDPVKDEEKEHPIATTWRPTLRQIANAIAEGDYGLSRGIPAVGPVSSATANQIRAYVSQYPETLTELSDDTWNSSVAQWMRTHWEVIVDLWTIESGRSDLILSGLDEVTADPHVREMIEDLWEQVGFGAWSYEVFAFIRQDPDTGAYSCERLPGTFQTNKFTIKKGTDIPDWTIAVIHTHPRVRTDKPDQGQDPAAARAFGRPLYVITKKGVGKFDPAVTTRGYRGTLEETTNSWSGPEIAGDGCKCPVKE